jgi:hypothetical protein
MPSRDRWSTPTRSRILWTSRRGDVANPTTKEDTMDPTMHQMARSVRSVQRAVMSAPTTTIADAVEAARRSARSVTKALEGSGRPVMVAGGASAA